ncbi:glycosyltransferase involved in cell wall biosynthesis [Paenibacillus castaneae]|uniref:glycosyltransferase family 2 protein n=1 Tax=Paenibacillus castaneae TaxID=474957 RepID=UPI000C9AB2F3|nr:glycosyltransferase family A protein [Paenibacillus castaneae]NIK77612.1 glycosyltransferase involved in cell wall biosynthesis [Paenibacillus castaneae]
MLNNAEVGVTIITSTIRPKLVEQVFNNYARQKWKSKELIIIINKNDIQMKRYEQKAKQYQNVRIYRMDEQKNLGECLNFGVSQAKYDYIAKFDDDDYYSPNYILESMHLFTHSKADVVGKRTCYFYFPHRSTLLLRRTSVPPYSPCVRIAGGTIMFHKRVFHHVRFSTQVYQGSDVRFVNACLKKGYHVYTTSSYNFVGIRRANRKSHTWKVSDKKLLSTKNAKIIHTTNFKKHCNRSPKQLALLKGYSKSGV